MNATNPVDEVLSAQPRVPEERRRWVPVAIAIASFVVLCNVVLSQAPKMIEPDPFAYRASIDALADGDVTLDQQQYDALSRKLQSTDLGGGIMQWHQQADGSWVSEKNPGYPYLAVTFRRLGAMRIAPLFFGMLGCIGLWFGARRWLGEWGAAFAVSTYCSSSAAMVFAWRETMPTFTDTSLAACGIGLLIWSVLSTEKAVRTRTAVGALAFLALGVAVFVRYTNLTVLAVAGLFAVLACLSGRWRLPIWSFAFWAAAVLVPLACALSFNVTYYGSPFSTGYPPGNIEFSLSAIPNNMGAVPVRLAEAMPVYLLSLVAIALMVREQVTSRHSERTITDRWVGSMLVACWSSTWLLYMTFLWTSRVIDEGQLPGIGSYTITRLFVPALGPIVLMAAWLLVRLPRVVALLTIAALLCFGIADFLTVANGPWANYPWFKIDVRPSGPAEN